MRRVGEEKERERGGKKGRREREMKRTGEWGRE